MVAATQAGARTVGDLTALTTILTSPTTGPAYGAFRPMAGNNIEITRDIVAGYFLSGCAKRIVCVR